MDRSGVKIFSLIGGGVFSSTKTKVAWNCLKWIDLMSTIFPSWGGGLFCHQNQSCSKLAEMDRSGVKKFSLIGRGGLFCHQNQSCLKLPEMDISGIKKIFPHLGRGGGGGFSATKTKFTQNCLKWIDLVSKNFPLFPLIWGSGGFSATKTKVAQNSLKWIDLVSNFFPSSGWVFLPPKPKLLKIGWNG